MMLQVQKMLSNPPTTQTDSNMLSRKESAGLYGVFK